MPGDGKIMPGETRRRVGSEKAQRGMNGEDFGCSDVNQEGICNGNGDRENRMQVKTKRVRDVESLAVWM